MPFSVVMPALEMAQETGKLLAWRKKEGDRVAKGEPLLDIETDKAVVEIEAPADGILAGIRASEGSDIPVGRTIAWIVAPGESAPSETESAVTVARAGSHADARSGSVSNLGQAPKHDEPSPRISPKARRLAKELGVDISTVRGSGPDGEILARDIQEFADHSANRPPQPLPGNIEVPGAIGRIMAERTALSWRTVPHFFVTREIDATGLKQYRDQIVGPIEGSPQIRITHTDLLIALVARVLLKHPRLNASWSPEGLRLHPNVNLGVAIALDDGVVAVVVHNAHTATVREIASQSRALAERARQGKLKPADIADATFTVSNLGMYGVDQFSAIIMPPQAAILAVGAIRDRVVAVEGKPAVRPMMTVTLSSDHRVADGARAARLLTDLEQAINNPEKWL